MHAIHKGYLLLHRQGSRRIVRHQHEFLDYPLGCPGRARLHVNAHAVFVGDYLGLRGVYLRRAPGDTVPFENVRQLLHDRNAVDDPGVLCPYILVGGAVDYAVDLGIHTLYAAAYHRFLKAVIQQLSLKADVHQAGKRQPVHLGVQGAYPVGKLPRQHGNHLVGVIDGGTAVECLLVQLAPPGDIMGNVRDMHTQLVAALRLGNAHRVVYILCVGAVDGEYRLAAQV